MGSSVWKAEMADRVAARRLGFAVGVAEALHAAVHVGIADGGGDARATDGAHSGDCGTRTSRSDFLSFTCDADLPTFRAPFFAALRRQSGPALRGAEHRCAGLPVHAVKHLPAW